MSDTGGGGGGAESLDSQVICHPLVFVTVAHRFSQLVSKTTTTIIGSHFWLKFGRSTVKVAKVKGNATTDEMVANGSVRRQDKDGNEAADRAADLGRRRQPELFNQCQKANPKCFKVLVPICL